MILKEKGENLIILDDIHNTRAASLLSVTIPDMVMLNIKLPRKEAIHFPGGNVTACDKIKLGMIVSDPDVYYMSLCRSFGSDYYIDKSLDLALIPEAVAKQRLN